MKGRDARGDVWWPWVTRRRYRRLQTISQSSMEYGSKGWLCYHNERRDHKALQQDMKNLRGLHAQYESRLTQLIKEAKQVINAELPGSIRLDIDIVGMPGYAYPVESIRRLSSIIKILEETRVELDKKAQAQ